jgi:hypothetical protein
LWLLLLDLLSYPRVCECLVMRQFGSVECIRGVCWLDFCFQKDQFVYFVVPFFIAGWCFHERIVGSLGLHGLDLLPRIDLVIQVRPLNVNVCVCWGVAFNFCNLVFSAPL